MRRAISFRVVLAAGCLAALVAAPMVASERAATTMAGAATKFLASLNADQRQKATFPFDSNERMHWHFIPTDMFARNGLTIKEMTPAQRTLAQDLLKTGLSQRGYMTATQIMELETTLGAMEAANRDARGGRGENMVRDPERYFFSVFGTPAPKGTWGWRVEGHHVSLHFTIVNGAFIAASPTFFGSNPAKVPSGPKAGMRILAAEEDSARALLFSLDPPRKTKAIINTAAPNDIVTANNLPISPLTPVGIAASDLAQNQRDLLMKLVDVYVSDMAADVAAERIDRVRKAGVEKITFAWAGEQEVGKKHYYRIQGPTFLVEYDNTQNDANHIHSIWRDFDGDFGRDLLREHVQGTAH